MKDKRSVHLKMQEFCDCFATADPLSEMGAVGAGSEPDAEEGAIKFLALAVLHGINGNAKKITIEQMKNGQVRVIAKYRSTELPAPSQDIAAKIFETARQITHIEDKKGKTPLALGIRDSSIELKIKIDQEDGCQVLKIKFPEMS
jgi:hypothetical protein